MARRDDSAWFVAASSGNLTSLCRMINTHKRSRNEVGETALMTAVRHNQLLAIQHLVPYEHSCINHEDFTALMIAVISGNQQAVEILCEYEYTIATRTGQTALMLAVVMNNHQAISSLAPYATGLRDNLGRTALMYAAFTGLTLAAQELIPYETGFTSQFGDTALSIAMERGHSHIVELLQSYEESPYLDTKYKHTSLNVKRSNQESELLMSPPAPIAQSTPFPTISLQQTTAGHQQSPRTGSSDDIEAMNDTVSSLLVDVLMDSNPSSQNLADSSFTIYPEEAANIVDVDELSIEPPSSSTSEEYLAQHVAVPLAQQEINVQRTTQTNTASQHGNTHSSSRLVVRPCIVRRRRKLVRQPQVTLPSNLTFIADASYTLLMRAVIAKNSEWFKVLCPYEATLRDSRGRTALMHASYSSNIEAAKDLIPFEAGLTDIQGQTALHYAAQRGHLEIVKLLLPKEGSIADTNGTTPLMLAALAKHGAVVTALLEHQACGCDKNQTTALMHAAQRGYLDITRILLPYESRMYTLAGETALMMAARFGFDSIVDLLLDREAGSQNNEGMTALMFASKHGHARVVARIVSSGMELRMTNYDGKTALMLAAEHNQIEAASVLAKYEAELRTYDDTTALMIAATLGYVNVVRVLAFAEAGSRDIEGRTALMCAARNNHVDCVEILLNYSREINKLTEDHFNALHIAVKAGSIDSVLLLSKFESPLPNAYGQTPLMSAASNGHEEIIEFLLEHGKSRDCDMLGRTALMYAAQHDQVRATTKLIPYEGGLRDKCGRTALIYAIECRNRRVIPFLLREAWLIDYHGKTPLEYALEQELYEFVDLITEHAMVPFNMASPATLSAVIKILYEEIGECVRTFYQQRIDSQWCGNFNDENGVTGSTDLLDPYQLDLVTDTEAQVDISILDDLLESMLDLLLGSNIPLNDSNDPVAQGQPQRIKMYETDTDEKLTEFLVEGRGVCCVCMARPPSFIGVPCGHTLMCHSCMVASISACPFCKAQIATVVAIDSHASVTPSFIAFSEESQYVIEEEEGHIVYRLGEQSDDILAEE
ncbi:Protein 21.1 [Giardia lamblia P15]|uniref:Protein 21.1 n=1 Tax=Giardia intestinalis (strain P15) TaxID=658858 RepID=E1F0B7_GIAIA|nr:Protein 21.1 [Giardia lamblia P15]